MSSFEIALGILVVLYGAVVIRQVISRGPPLWSLFLVAALALLVTETLPGSEALGSVSAPVLLFLFGMFVFGVALDEAGVLAHLARYLAGRGRTPADLLFYLFLAMGLLSTVLVNDAIAVLGTPLLIGLARRIQKPVAPFLLTLAYSVTVGSVPTPMGNPQNLLVALESGLPHPLTTFLVYLLAPTLVNLLLGGLFVRHYLGRKHLGLQWSHGSEPPPRIPFFPGGDWPRRIRSHPSLFLFPATMVVGLATSVGGAAGLLPSVPLYQVVLAGGLITLLLESHRVTLLKKVDWGTLLLFVGLFVVMGGMVAGGVVARLADLVPLAPAPGGGLSATGLLSLMGSTLGAVQIFSNVPWVALSLHILQAQGFGGGNPRVWMALAASATLGGNLTFLGAASNLIIVNQAEREKVRLRLGEFVRYGVPLTALTTAVVLGFLLVGL